MDLIAVLTDLSLTPAPSGSESQMAALGMKLLGPHMDEVSVDPLGSVIGRRACGKQGARRVLIEAHMDEVGFIVTGHKGSFLTLSPIGSIDLRQLPGTRLRVLTEPPQAGVIACLPPHVLSKGDMDKVTSWDDTLLDLGLTEDEVKHIPLGTPAVYDTRPALMGETRFSGKALDNRASIVTILLMLEALPKTPDFDLFILLSTQEELGMRGAGPGAFAVEPDLCIALDVTFAHTPDASKEQTVLPGGGPAIGIGPVLDRTFSKRLTELAETQHIPHQFEILSGSTSTTADKLQTVRAGVPTALISLPLRYMHSASELVDLTDIRAAASLLTAFLQDLEGGASHA